MADSDNVHRLKSLGFEETARKYEQLEKTLNGIRKAMEKIEKESGTAGEAIDDVAEKGASGFSRFQARVVSLNQGLELVARFLRGVQAPLEAFAAQDRNIAQLQRNVSNLGISWEEMNGRIERFVEMREDLTGIADVITRDVMNNIAQATAGAVDLTITELERLTVLAQDIQTALPERSIAEVSRQIGRVLGGNLESLNELVPLQRKYINDLTRSAPAAFRAQEGIRILSETYGGASESIGSATLAMRQVGSSWSDVLEKVGALLAPFVPLVAKLVEGLEGFLEIMLELLPVLELAVDILDPLVTVIGGLPDILTDMGEGFGFVSRESEATFDTMRQILGISPELVAALRGSMTRGFSNLTSVVAEHREELALLGIDLNAIQARLPVVMTATAAGRVNIEDAVYLAVFGVTRAEYEEQIAAIQAGLSSINVDKPTLTDAEQMRAFENAKRLQRQGEENLERERERASQERERREREEERRRDQIRRTAMRKLQANLRAEQDALRAAVEARNSLLVKQTEFAEEQQERELEALREAVDERNALLQKQTEFAEQMQQANAARQEAVIAGFEGFTQLSGQLASAFVSDEGTKARILGFVEAAAAFAAGARFQFFAAAQHAVASVAYFRAAREAGKSGGGAPASVGSAGRRERPESRPTPPPIPVPQAAGFQGLVNNTFVFTGMPIITERHIQRSIRAVMNASAGFTGGAFDPRISGG